MPNADFIERIETGSQALLVRLKLLPQGDQQEWRMDWRRPFIPCLFGLPLLALADAIFGIRSMVLYQVLGGVGLMGLYGLTIAERAYHHLYSFALTFTLIWLLNREASALLILAAVLAIGTRLTVVGSPRERSERRKRWRQKLEDVGITVFLILWLGGIAFVVIRWLYPKAKLLHQYLDNLLSP